MVTNSYIAIHNYNRKTIDEQSGKLPAVFVLEESMKTYIYPENLRASVKLWFWSVRDFIIICTGVVLSVVSLVYMMNILPAAATLCYAFVSFRPDENSILDFIVTAFRFFCTSQQEYRWQQKGE